MNSVLEELELGCWREASRILDEVGLSDAYLTAILMGVARAMSYRAAGDHGLAWATLGVAAARMHRRYPRLPLQSVNETGEEDDIPSWPGEVVRLALPRQPAAGGDAELVYRAVQLIWREQGELSDLFRWSAEPPSGLTADKHILVLAFVEYMCWVRHDPGTWTRTAPADEEAAAVEERIGELRDGLRAAFLRSATDLRRLRRPDAGEMSRMVWNGAGKYNGLQRLAILELARRSAPPWVDSAKPADCPARQSALNASQFARPA